MSFDQRLIRKNGLFAASWIAGTNNSSLLKVYKRHELETVNVPNTCNQLCLAIAHMSRNFKQVSSKPMLTNNDTIVYETKIPFRIITKLCYGTIHIYQLQVNNLLRLSKDLASRSNYAIKSITATKRSSSDTYLCSKAPASKKRRNIKPIPNEESSNYSELLKESEQLAKLSQRRPSLFEESNSTIIKPSKNNTPNLSRIRIREITIREINAEFALPDFDDDEGFGNATPEELAHYIDLFSDNNNNEAEMRDNRNALKRKASTTEQRPSSLNKISKITYDNDSTIELVRCEGAQNETSVVELICGNTNNFDLRSSPDKSTTISPNMTAISNDNDDVLANDHSCAVEIPSLISNPVSNYNILTENNSTPKSTNMRLKQKTNTKTKLIVDYVTMKSEAELLAELENNNTWERRSTISVTEKHLLATSNKLLTRLSRDHSVKLNFKAKINISEEIIQKDYINILRDIVGHPIDNHLATEVYANWNINKNNVRNAKNKNNAKKVKAINENSRQLPLNGDLVEEQTDASNYEINNNQNNDHSCNNCYAGINDKMTLVTSALRDKNVSEAEFLNSESSKMEYQAYDIMMKLLDIWRVSKVDKIDVKSIFKTMKKNRHDAAAAFSSLLILAKKGFIKISHYENTCQMQYIELGSASEKLLNDILVNTEK